MKLCTIEGHTFDLGRLSRDSVVLDLGANQGRFSRQVAELTGCRCIAVEANPALCEAMRSRPGATIISGAVAGKPGRVSLRVNASSESSTIMNVDRRGELGTVEVEALTVEQIAERCALSQIDLVKVDIEGAEIEMFECCSEQWLQSVSQFTVEFHDFNGLTPRRDVVRVVRRLERLGFFAVPFWMRSHGDTWFVNRRRHPASLASLLWLRYVQRNANGVAKALRRRLGGASTLGAPKSTPLADRQAAACKN